jgi:hypothetical protein
MTAAKTVLLDEKKNTSDWFKMSADVLVTRDRLRTAHDDYRKTGKPQDRRRFVYAKRKHRQCIKNAKKLFANKNALRACEGIRKGDHQGWKALQIIEKGTRAHHTETKPLTIQDPETMETAVTDVDNLKAVGKFYNGLFNRDDVNTDFSVLKDMRPTETELGHTPTKEEIL